MKDEAKAKIYISRKGILICGKIEKVRTLLAEQACTCRTIKELIKIKLN